nr:hypothetical protein [synthetic construct]
MLARDAMFATFPATLTVNSSPSPVSNTISGTTLLSAHPRITANGDCPPASNSLRVESCNFLCAVSETKRLLPSFNLSIISAISIYFPFFTLVHF